MQLSDSCRMRWTVQKTACGREGERLSVARTEGRMTDDRIRLLVVHSESMGSECQAWRSRLDFGTEGLCTSSWH
jgi:hypothetical protein